MKLKTLLLTTTLVASQAFASAPVVSKEKSANHIDNYYAKLEAGITMPETIRVHVGKLKTKNGLVSGIGAGYRINEFFRTDLMLQYREIRTVTGRLAEGLAPPPGASGSVRINAFSAMLNGYLERRNDTIFTPYLMAGIGASFLDTGIKGHGITFVGVRDTSGRIRRAHLFAWNIGFGAQAKLTNQASLDFSYRHINLGRPGRKREINGIPLASVRFSRELRTHEVLAGLIWHF